MGSCSYFGSGFGSSKTAEKPPQNWSDQMRIGKHSKPRRSNARARARFFRLAAIVFVAGALSANGCAKTIVEFHCPFGPASIEVEDEELDGALDDAPATVRRLMDIDHECGFDSEPEPGRFDWLWGQT